MATKKAIKFFATWCGPCKIYGKTWSKVEKEYEGKLEFQEVDVDKDTTGLAAKYKVQDIPYTVIIKDDGTEIKETGRLNYSELTKLINE